MKFSIDKHILEKFPGLIIGVVIAKGVDNNGIAEEVEKELRIAEDEVKKKYSIETLFQIPKIEVWRKTYSTFGANQRRTDLQLKICIG